MLKSHNIFYLLCIGRWKFLGPLFLEKCLIHCKIPKLFVTDIFFFFTNFQTVKGLNVFVDHQLREGCKVKTNQYPCKFCGSVFSEKKLLIAHKKACTEASLINGAYECDICGRR